jgi:undecaprenyl-diphosphatase
MMTIVGGYFVGLSRKHSAEFSFLLGLVTLTAAAGYKVVTKGTTLLQNLDVGPMLFGCVIAGFSAALSVRWLVGFLTRHGLSLFVWYRVILGAIILIYASSF